MKTSIRCCVVSVLVAFGVIAPMRAQDASQKIAAAKQAAARNQQALHGYSWTEQVQLLVKGEAKNTKVSSCQYGPDGKVQKTQLSAPPAAKPKQRGLKGKVIEKKTGEMKEEMESAVALIHRYVPPAPDKIQAVVSGGNAKTADAGAGGVTLNFTGYEKPGDLLSLTFDSAVYSLKQLAVTTWLEKPEDPVTVRVTMQSLPDGTDYPASITLAIPASQIEVRVNNSNYQKIR